MIKLLVRLLIVVILLVVLIPLIMLLFGEGALAYKIFDWSCTNGDGSEYVIENGNRPPSAREFEKMMKQAERNGNAHVEEEVIETDEGTTVNRTVIINNFDEIEDIFDRVDKTGDISDEDFDRLFR